jgi:hypothetical protein
MTAIIIRKKGEAIPVTGREAPLGCDVEVPTFS